MVVIIARMQFKQKEHNRPKEPIKISIKSDHITLNSNSTDLS